MLASCSKDAITTDSDAKLNYLSQSVNFDTVFTAAGTTTRIFTISNPNDKAVRIDEIRLMGGSASAFSMNVNGQAGPVVNNMLVNAEDSIYIFLTAHINPDANEMPFLVEDSIQVSYNGNRDVIDLNAYGQNAIYLNNPVINTDTTWGNSLPIVLTGTTTISVGKNLSIVEGAKLYFHQGASLVLNGSLQATGSFEQPIIFRGDRLDEAYRDLPGGWKGVVFTESSTNNSMHFVNVLNAENALTLLGHIAGAAPKLTISQCRISNASKSGIYAVNASLKADNSLISNCNESFKIENGGNIEVINCTVASYSTNYVLHNKPGVFIANFIDTAGTVHTAPLLASFTNTIFWGDQETEFQVVQNTAADFSLTLSHCIYKAATEPTGVSFLNSYNNFDPLFDTVEVFHNKFDFHISDISSPTIDTGLPVTEPADLDNNPRTVNNTDIGCYEKQ